VQQLLMRVELLWMMLAEQQSMIEAQELKT
jgi:hypothetical protein